VAHSTLPVLTHPQFPQVFEKAIPRFGNLVLGDTTCTFHDSDGCECGRAAVLQVLPLGDEAFCWLHAWKFGLMGIEARR